MSDGGRDVRLRAEVLAIFAEGQGAGAEWFEATRTFGAGRETASGSPRHSSIGLSVAERRQRAARIVEAVRSGRQRREVALEHGVSCQSVCRHARRAGLPHGPWHKRGPLASAETKRARLLEALRAGTSRAEAARRADMSIHQAKKLALSAGLRLDVSIRERAQRVEGRNRSIVDAVLSGERTAAVARQHGISRRRVCVILHCAGVRLGRSQFRGLK